MFVSNFFVVFLLGMQSKNVQQSRYVAAIATSFGISVAQAMFVQYVAAGDITAFLVCAAGGCVGIAAAIWTHDRLLTKRKPQEVRDGNSQWMPVGRLSSDLKWGEPGAGSLAPKSDDLFEQKGKGLW